MIANLNLTLRHYIQLSYYVYCMFLNANIHLPNITNSRRKGTGMTRMYPNL